MQAKQSGPVKLVLSLSLQPLNINELVPSQNGPAQCLSHAGGCDAEQGTQQSSGYAEAFILTWITNTQGEGKNRTCRHPSGHVN